MEPILRDSAILRQGKFGLPKKVFVELHRDHLEIYELRRARIISRAGLSHLEKVSLRLHKLTFINQGEIYVLLFAKHKFGVTWAGPLFYYMNAQIARKWKTTISDLRSTEAAQNTRA